MEFFLSFLKFKILTRTRILKNYAQLVASIYLNVFEEKKIQNRKDCFKNTKNFPLLKKKKMHSLTLEKFKLSEISQPVFLSHSARVRSIRWNSLWQIAKWCARQFLFYSGKQSVYGHIGTRTKQYSDATNVNEEFSSSTAIHPALFWGYFTLRNMFILYPLYFPSPIPSRRGVAESLFDLLTRLRTFILHEKKINK